MRRSRGATWLGYLCAIIAAVLGWAALVAASATSRLPDLPYTNDAHSYPLHAHDLYAVRGSPEAPVELRHQNAVDRGSDGALGRTFASAYTTYDSQHHHEAPVDTELERGPPACPPASLATSTYAPAVGLWSSGRFARPDDGAPALIYTYDGTTCRAQAGDSWGTGAGFSQGSDGEPSALRFAGVAANNVPTVVFSRSRAPGIAGNFDNAVANGAPTRLTRVDAAARDANRRAALRGQSPAPAGQLLDEYPFACSAQGGCGSFISRVPVGEHSYQVAC